MVWIIPYDELVQILVIYYRFATDFNRFTTDFSICRTIKAFIARAINTKIIQSTLHCCCFLVSIGEIRLVWHISVIWKTFQKSDIIYFVKLPLGYYFIHTRYHFLNPITHIEFAQRTQIKIHSEIIFLWNFPTTML